MDNVCKWEYKKYSYLITIKHFEKEDDYILFGDKYESMTNLKIDNYIKSDYWIEEDDNISQIINKISYELKIETEKIHIYAINTNINNEIINLKYDYFISSGRAGIIETINVVPNFFDYSLKKINRLTKETYKPITENTLNILQNNNILNKNNLENNLINSFNLVRTVDTLGNEYYTNIHIILYDDAIEAVKSSKLNNYDTRKQFEYNYYPDLTKELKKNMSYINFKDLKNDLDKDKNQIEKLYNAAKVDNKYKLKLTDCTIVEVIIHVNYNNYSQDFIDQVKIFHSLRLSHDIPFVKYKGDLNMYPQFRIYKELTNPESDIFINEKKLENWTFKTKNKISKDLNDLTISGKGLSYRIFLYKVEKKEKGKFKNKYLTVNIYKNGKLEIKCNWSDNKSGNLESVINAVKKVRDFVREINKIDFQMIGTNNRNKLIEEPDIDFLTNKFSNTKIAFYNINYELETHTKIKTNVFEEYIKKYDTFVNFIEKNRGDIESNIELRYKRINGYLKMDKINNYIYKLYKAEFSRDEIIHLLEVQYNVNRETAKGFYNKYLTIVAKKPINKIINDNDADDVKLNRVVLNEQIKGKNPGTDIKLLYNNNNKYKVIILGTPQNSVGQIYFFIKTVIEKFLNKNTIKDKKSDIVKNKFGNKLLDINFDDYIEESYVKSSSNDIDDISSDDEALFENNDLNINKPIIDVEFKPEPTDANLLSRLKFSNNTLFYKDKYKNNSYSRKCQQPIKHPLVISSKKALDLIDKQRKLLAEAQEKNNKSKIKEISENLKILEEKGRHIKGYFYFCPSKWDADNYEPISDKSVNIINKHNFTKLGFSNEVCQPCCMTEHKVSKHVRLDDFCMNKFNNNSKESYADLIKNTKVEIKTHKAYILEASKLFNETSGRYIHLPNELNKIFNPNKTCSKSNLKDNDRSITCYLRKTVEKGNYFLNAIAETINAKPSVIINNINNLKYLLLSDPNKLNRLYRSLKRGSIYDIFIDESYLNDNKDKTSADLTYFSFYNFLQYINSNVDTINEKFLWDLLSYKNIVVKNTGVNIFIIEGFIIGQNILADNNIKIKCPLGYEIDTLYDIKRPSIVLFKYINNSNNKPTYEIICEATYTIKKIQSKILFEPNNPIIANFIKNIKKCDQINDINASDEFKKYINNVGHATIIDRLYDLEITPLTIQNIEKSIEKMISDYPNEFDDYRIKSQIIDRYNKVRYLLLYNGFLLPINPCTVSLNYNIEYDINKYKLSYYETMEKILVLEKYALIKRITPFSFLIDPGLNLTDPTDDLVMAILLRNGTYINIEPILVSIAVETIITVNKPSNLIPIVYNSSKLLFKENMKIDDVILKKKDVHSQYIFNNEFKIDRELLFNKNIKDNRIRFTVRQTYEEESYERLRFELSKFFQTEIGLKKKTKIETIVNSNETIDLKRIKINKILKKIIMNIIVLSSDITDQKYIDKIEYLIGPLNKGFNDDFNIDNNPKYAYEYIKPVIKNICSSENENNEHCYNKKLFISNVNLNTGNINNLDNYINRINEEILRNSFKRSEILNDQIDNSIKNIPHIESEWYIDTEKLYNKNTNIKDFFDKIYSKNLTIDDKNDAHYDIKNPITYNTNININLNSNELNNLCKGDYVQLPLYWINKIKDTKYKIYKTNHNSCIFTLIKQAKESLYNNESINDLKISIIGLLNDNKNIYKQKGDKKDLWELAKIAYSERYARTIYFNLFDVDTPNDVYEAIKNNDREIIDIDLSFISYIIGVKFIILCEPGEKKNKAGIECLGTTQTNSEYYILLYKNMFNEYYIIYDYSFVKPKSIFRRDELEDVIIYETWKAECGATDENIFINKLNHLFKPNRYIYNYQEKDGKILVNDSLEVSNFQSSEEQSNSNDYLYNSDDEF